MAISLLVLPAGLIFAQTPDLPIIPSYTTNIASLGANGNGVATNTTAIQNAINAVSLAGGGTVEIPSGTFLSGPLNFSNSINLQLDSGAILRMLPYLSYPGGTSPADFITTASSGHDLEVSGTGTIDGQATFSGWWGHGLGTSERPTLFFFNKCNRVLVENVTLENPPSMHMVFKGGGGNVTIQGITINTSGSSPNTDGIDLIGTNCLVSGCSISDGDDCIALGSTGGTSSDTLVTNCIFGSGHGLSIGSNTAGGVSNLVVANCTFNGTQYGIRLKSDNATSSGGEGGLTQNLFYYNIQMVNIQEAPIVIYSYYNETGTPIGVSPSTAQGETVDPVTSTTCIWRNIIISNLTATADTMAGIIWGRTELPVTNVLLSQVNITAPATFDVYNAYGVELANSQVTVPSGNKTFTIFNAGMTVTNTTPGSGSATLDGLTSTNSLALYNTMLSTTASDIFGADPITVSGSTLTVSNSYLPPAPESFNFALGTDSSTIAVDGNLIITGAMINVTSAPGFGPGLYTLFTYTGAAGGSYALGSTPANFNYALTNATGKIQLLVSTTGPSLTPVNLLLQNIGGQLELTWPQDHIGWSLEIQTNKTSVGLSNNWSVVSGSATTNKIFLPVSTTNGCVFLRLAYPN
ncbi:MAG TPA: glycosyl hydrolase family 28 protein [Candidatus Acidoferrales bacterium]|nr:glycosyl hydrolase family 28 protein [Candidatus Acidoferrales bacterium]